MGGEFNYMELPEPDSGDLLAIFAEFENRGAK